MKLLKFSIIVFVISLVITILGTLLGTTYLFFTNIIECTFLEVYFELFGPLFIFIFLYIVLLSGIIYLGARVCIKYFSKNDKK